VRLGGAKVACTHPDRRDREGPVDNGAAGAEKGASEGLAEHCAQGNQVWGQEEY